MNVVYNQFLYLFFTQQIDFANDSFKVALLQEGYTPNAVAHQALSDIAAFEVVGGGYTAGGTPLTGVSITTASNGIPYVTADNAVWEDSSLSAKYAVIYKVGANAAQSPLIACFEFPAIQQSLNGTFTVQWSEEGILQLLQCAEE
jgi:hypothetical protein